MDNHFTSYKIADRSYVAFVKREIHNKILQSHFSKVKMGQIDIVVSEMTSNLIKHPGQGELLYRLNDSKEGSVFEIISIDNGPGMNDVQRMMKDGVSTTNTLGQGLGAIKRLSSDFQIYSIPKWGTVSYSVTSSKETEGQKKAKDNYIDVKAICIPKPPEIVCGDGYRVKANGPITQLFFGDGLGHGPNASQAIYQAGEFFLSCEESNPVEIIRQMHERVRKTRGLVCAVAILNMTTRKWQFCGVGNIATRLYTGIENKHYMSYNGIVGLNIPNTMKAHEVEAENNQQVIMCSDGLRTRWEITKYPAIMKHDSALLAAAIYKDNNRGNDDSSILIGKILMNG